METLVFPVIIFYFYAAFENFKQLGNRPVRLAADFQP